MSVPYFKDHAHNEFCVRHEEKIAGVISCYDRLIIKGTLSSIGYDRAMEQYLRSEGVMLKDYQQWAGSKRDEIKANAVKLAKAAGVQIEHVRSSKSFRKEQRVKQIIAERGEAVGLVHVFSAMEPCNSFRWRYDRASGETHLRPVQSRCLHYYFYFIDEVYGLCYVRVPTWAPFMLQVYLNGHQRLARQLDNAGIDYDLVDNAFVRIDDFAAAQKLSNSFSADQLKRRLRQWSKQYCPPSQGLPGDYYWTIMQAEYATDVVFHRQADFMPLYDEVVRTAVHSVRADEVAMFLGRKLHSNYQDQVGNDFTTRIQGTRIRHSMGAASLKVYDKMGLMIRVECTVNDVPFFKLHRWVDKRDGSREWQLAPLRKNIYSLRDLGCLMNAATGRYLTFMSDIEDPSGGLRLMRKISNPVRHKGRGWRGFNLLDEQDYKVFVALLRGDWAISGFRNKDLREHLPHLTGWRVSYLLRRLRTHGIIKKVARRHKYYLTKMGRRVLAAAVKVRHDEVLPLMC